MALQELALKFGLPIETLEKVFTSKSVHILFTGRTGVGKSTLINCLVGKAVAKEGDDLKPQTMEVQSYTTCLNGVDVTVWDSPGLQDGTGNEARCLQEMRDKCGKGCDLVVYCIKMTETRFTADETKAIKMIINEFGDDIWKNAVFVLSCANHVIRLAPKKDPNGHLQKRFDLFKDMIPKQLLECGIKKEIIDLIPIIPAGHMDMDEVGGGPVLSPLTKDWLSDFWFTSITRMKDSSKRGMVLAAAGRLKKEEEITKEDRMKPASEQPIACSKEKEETLLRTLGIPVAVGGTIGAVLTGVAGAAAVAFGILGGPLTLIGALAAIGGGVVGGVAGGVAGGYAGSKK